MKIFSIIIVCLFLCSTSWAEIYYVDAAKGKDTNSGTSSYPWETIGKANSSLRAGDTVYIKKGTYKTTISPDYSGSKGSYITYANYQQEEVIITGVKHGADLSNKQYIVLDGLKILNVSGCWVEMYPKGSYNIIQNCHMEEAELYYGIRLKEAANYNSILNNTFIGSCGPDDLIQIRDSGHNLIDGNKLYYGPHNSFAIYDRATGNTYNIIRNNFIQNKWHSNVDIWGADYILIENNTIYDGGILRSDNSCGSERDRTMSDVEHKGINSNTKYAIVRNNILAGNGMGIELASYPHEEWKGICASNRYYNNTINKNIVGIRSNDKGEKKDIIIKNNILYNNSRDEIWIGGSENSITYINNNIKGGGTVYGVSSNALTNNLSLNPLFTDEAGRDFTLQSTSKMIDAGAFLTKTTVSGSGVSIKVEDARYFMDGWGIIEGDLIQLEDQTQTARITKVDYTTNTITVDTALQWAANQGISLAYKGTAPDIGALEFDSDPPPPPPPGPDPDEIAKHCCLFIEAEDMTLSPPMVKGIDENASGKGFIETPEGESSFSPLPEATYQFTLPQSGIYYLWIRMNGVRGGYHALYIGIDSTWDRVYPSNHGVYEWVRVEVTNNSANYEFNLNAGSHTLQIGHGEINAKADAVYLSNNPDKEPGRLTSPTFQPKN